MVRVLVSSCAHLMFMHDVSIQQRASLINNMTSAFALTVLKEGEIRE